MAAWKVGLLVVLSVGLFVGGYAILGRSLFAPPTETYIVEMSDASGVVDGSRVLMAGVQVGTVESVALQSPTLARLQLRVNKDVKIPEDSKAQISGSLIGLGDVPLHIVPGKSPSSLAPGAIISGAKQNPLESMLPGSGDLLKGLAATLEETKLLLADTRKIVNDRELNQSVRKLLATTENTVAQYGALASQIDSVVRKNQGRIGEALNSATLAMNDIRKSTKAVAQALENGKLTDKTIALVDSLTQASDKAGKLVGDLSAFVNDPELRDPLRRVAANTEKITESGARAATDVEKIVKNGVEISENTKTLTDKANDLADETRTILQQLQRIIGTGVTPGKVDFEGGMDVVRDNALGRMRTDFEGNVRLGDAPIRFGIHDAFETNKINLQTSRKLLPNLDAYYGIFASKPGVGVEYEVARGLTLRGDLYDLTNPRADLRARYSLGGGFYGWLGLNQVFKRNSLLIGLGIRK